MFIPDPDFFYPESRIQQKQKKKGENKYVASTFLSPQI